MGRNKETLWYSQDFESTEEMKCGKKVEVKIMTKQLKKATSYDKLNDVDCKWTQSAQYATSIQRLFSTC